MIHLHASLTHVARVEGRSRIQLCMLWLFEFRFCVCFFLLQFSLFLLEFLLLFLLLLFLQWHLSGAVTLADSTC